MRRSWMPLYITDFIADTVHLSAAETGAYLCLIMDYWLHDGLPDDDVRLAQTARLPVKSWREMRPAIQAFFHDGWRHKRIDAELTKMVDLNILRKKAASRGGTQAAINRLSGKEPSSKRKSFATSKTGSKTGSKTLPNEHYTTQENITSTFVGTARASENPAITTTTEPAATKKKRLGKGEVGVGSSAELNAVMAAKRWIP